MVSEYSRNLRCPWEGRKRGRQMEKRTFVDRTSVKQDTGKALENKVDYLTGQGVPHPVRRTVEEMRRVMLGFGFDEVELSIFLPEDVLLKAFSDLYPLYQDMTYYVAWLKHQKEELEDLRPAEMSDEHWIALKEILWEVVDDNISLEEGVYRAMEEMGVEFQVALNILLQIWERVRGEVLPQRLTLRSAMPVAWMPTLRALTSEEMHPLKLFTVSKVFRREHLMEETHGRVFSVLSAVIMDPEIEMDAGLTVVRTALERLGMKDVEFRYKHYSPPYYQPAQEYELFYGGVEVGTCGMLRKSVLEANGVSTPVFHFEIGVERFLMARDGYPDIKGLEFPQFYRKWRLTDKEIAEGIKPLKTPRTDWGRELAKTLSEGFKAARKEGKVRMKVLSENLTIRGEEIRRVEEGEKRVSIFIGGLLKDEILGPAAGDQIVVLDGNIMGVPKGELKKVIDKQGATPSGYDYVWPLCLLSAYKVESWIKKGSEKGEVVVEKVRSLKDVNLTLEPHVKEYILSRGKSVEVQGPLFFRVGFRGETQ